MWRHMARRRQGTVVSIVAPAERFVVKKLARELGLSIPEVLVSGGEVVLASSKSHVGPS